jgi:hypothetical protein
MVSQVEATADYGGKISRLSGCLDKDAGCLAPTNQHIVGPLQPDRRIGPGGYEGVGDG